VLWIKGLTVILLVQGRWEMAVLLAVTAILFVTMLWIYVLPAIMLVQCRGEMAVLPTVTAVLLHHRATDI